MTGATVQGGERRRVVVTGAAGLVGQNLIPHLKRFGCSVVAIDKHPANTRILKRLHADLEVIEADLARDESWQTSLEGADGLVACHGVVGALDPEEFAANKVTASERLLAAAKRARVGHIVQISSAVVISAAVDLYTESKKARERLATASVIPCVVLRPTLMFGWFDRKHIGWLARFMPRAPLFPVPGNGRYLRQPLYAGDFSNIVAVCVQRRIADAAYNISGLAKINYIDLIRELRGVLGLRTPLVRIPYGMFWLLLKAYAAFDRDPPFTTKQLEALVTPDVFEATDWPGIFCLPPTPLREALCETFRDSRYSQIALEF